MQPGLRTVQGVLQEMLEHIIKVPVVIDFAGRTDAGVHAVGQVVSFRTDFKHGPEALKRALQSLLPRDVMVREALEVADSFHARRCARQRWYRYTVNNGACRRPLLERHSYFYAQRLQVARMNEAAEYLLGAHDFIAFGDVPGGRGSSVRRLHRLQVERNADIVTIDLTASAFLRHMARSIVGLLLRVGSNKVEPWEAARVLQERDRGAAGPVAPARGLCLMGVTY